MSEIDLKTKIEGLEKAIKEHKDFSTTYEDQLKETQQELKDYNKPELTGGQLDDIYEAVENAVSNFDFSDSDNYEKEFGIDYDGRVMIESLELTSSTELVEAIVEKVSRLFKEIPSNEEGKADNS